MTETSMPNRLYGTPHPIPGESAASWVQRVCQSFDATLSRISQVLSISETADIDLAWGRNAYEKLSQLTGISLSAFAWMQCSFGRITETPVLLDLLNRRRPEISPYRFCPECLKTDPIPYLRLEWRFKCWKSCPTHRCDLLRGCPGCGRGLQLHRSLLGGGRNPPPVPSLKYCGHCYFDLGSGKSEPMVETVDSSANLSFQRAIVSSVLHGTFRVQQFEGELPLVALYPLTQKDLLIAADPMAPPIPAWILMFAGGGIECLEAVFRQGALNYSREDLRELVTDVFRSEALTGSRREYQSLFADPLWSAVDEEPKSDNLPAMGSQTVWASVRDFQATDLGDRR